MLSFILGLSVLVVVNLITDHEAQREGLNELTARFRLGS